MSPAEIRDRCRVLAESCKRKALRDTDPLRVDQVAWLLTMADDLREIADSPE